LGVAAEDYETEVFECVLMVAHILLQRTDWILRVDLDQSSEGDSIDGAGEDTQICARLSGFEDAGGLMIDLAASLEESERVGLDDWPGAVDVDFYFDFEKLISLEVGEIYLIAKFSGQAC